MICKVCGEHWDLDSIHEAIECEHPEHSDACRDAAGKWDQERYERDYFAPMLAAFRRLGCKALDAGATYCVPPAEPDPNIDLQAELEAMLGDDVDGIEAMLEDFGGAR